MGKYTTKKETTEVSTEEDVVTAPEEKKTPTKSEAKTTSRKSEPKNEPKSKKTFEPSDMISCRSICQGGLYLEGPRTKMPYQWSDYGATEDIEYRDLVELVRTRSSYVFSPFFIIDDVDFVNEFTVLKKFYEDNYTVTELSAVLDMPVNEMIDAIKSLPKSALDTLKSIAASQVSVGQIDSVRKIKALDQIFGTDLNLLSELFQ